MASQGTREYECILFGATGYTGKYTAEHITSHLPTDFKWAVAGRSQNKLQILVEELKTLNADRLQPSIEVAQLEKTELVELAKKTKVLITTVGPYSHYGTMVVEACASTGTHYLDVTGEVPWVKDMIEKYDDTAKRTGAIMIPQNGIESAPTDLISWKLASLIRDEVGTGTAEVIHSVYDMKAAPSGGTLATLLSMFDNYTPAQLAEAQKPWCLCPATPTQQMTSKSLLERITGVREVKDLGTLTDSLQGPADVPIVQRSWFLYGNGEHYGKNFHVNAYMRARNALTGFGVRVALLAGFTALSLPPVRWLIKQFVYQPGEGPTKEQVSNEFMEWRAIAYPDSSEAEHQRRAYGKFRWDGSMYDFTGICVAESALILSREKTFAHELGGGMLTPATLGEKYLDRLQKCGAKTEFKMMD